MKKILIFFLLMLSLTAQADKWYIATAANGGDDADGDGSITSPWLTLKHAADTITGAAFVGDTIVVGAGTFTEPDQIALGAGVSIYGAGATSIITTGAALSPIIYLSSVAEATDGAQSISYIQVDGDLTAVSLIYVSGRKNVKIHHCTFVDALTYGVTFRGKVATSSGAPATFATGNEFHDNTMTNCAIYTTEGRGNLEFSGQSGLLIYNNTITQTDRGGTTHGYGIKAVINNGYNHGVKIYNNTITVPEFENAGFEFAIELWTQRGGFEIYNNKFSGGVDFGGYDTNDSLSYGYAAKVYDNTFTRSGLTTYKGRGVILELGIHDGVYIYNNLFHRISEPIEFGPGANDVVEGVEDVYIHHNIFWETRRAGAGYTGYIMQVVPVGTYPTTFDNIQFLHNVIYNSTSGTLAASFWCGDTDGHTFTNTVVRNNIFVNSYSTVKFESCTVTTINVDNNNWYNCSNNIVYTDCTVTGNTAANNITTDPTFVSTSDFHLQSTSGCVNTGADVSATTGGTDFNGASLYGAAYDIGAFEYGANRMLKIDDTTLPTINYKLILIDH